MCGIAGGFGHTLSPTGEQQVLSRLQHRGPDSNGIWRGDGVWLANTRLAIQDLSPAGNQPMHSADDRYTLVYNGELYNAGTLRARLQAAGYTFRSSSDTEVLLNAFSAWQESCLQLLEGDFAFAVWDQQQRSLFLARDHMGVKPLYVYQDGRQTVFSSELKALLSIPGLDYGLDAEAFHEYLLYLYTPSEKTPFRHIRKLMPGCFLKLSKDSRGQQSGRYYSLAFKPDNEKSQEDWKQELDATMNGAVCRQLQSDAPLGIMLSGGLDSGLIAAIARKVRPELPLHAFTMDTGGGMADEGFEDDLEYARLLAAQLGLPLTEVGGDVQPDASWIDQLVWDLDEPQADPAAWYTGMIAQNAREQGIKVLLSGTGGDDVFSGYRRHQAIPFLKAAPYLPAFTARIPQFFKSSAPASRRLSKLFSSASLPIQKALIRTYFWARPETVDTLFQPGLQTTANPYRVLEELLANGHDLSDLLSQMLYLEQAAYLPHHNLAYLDKMGMSRSIEMRVPFADQQVVALAGSMPSSVKMQGRVTKAILRKVAADYLPASVIQRKKTGFGAPLRSWIKGPLTPLLSERLTDPGFLRHGIFDSRGIEALVRDTVSGKQDGAYTLFSLLCIESWLRQFA